MLVRKETGILWSIHGSIYYIYVHYTLYTVVEANLDKGGLVYYIIFTAYGIPTKVALFARAFSKTRGVGDI